MKAWQTYSSLFLNTKWLCDEVLFICYVNNIIWFILIVHNTVYLFTSNDSMKNVKIKKIKKEEKKKKKKDNIHTCLSVIEIT